MFENPRRGRQARNFTTNVPKILDLKSSSEQIFSRKLSLGAPAYRHDRHVLISNNSNNIILDDRWTQSRPQGLLLVQNGSRRNPWPRPLKYSKNRGAFCHVTHNEMAFSEVVSSKWRPCLFSAIGNCCSDGTKTFRRVYVTKF